MRAILLLCMLLCGPAWAADDKNALFTGPLTWRADQSLTLAEKMIADGKNAEALDVLDIAIRRNIRNTDAHVDKALALVNLGRLDDAYASLTNAIAVDRAHLGAYALMGLVSLARKTPDQARTFLGAIRVVCQGETCAEYQMLKKRIAEFKP